MRFVELGTRALRVIKAVGQGVPSNDDDLQVAFETCQDMFDGFSVQRLTVFQTLRSTYPIVAAQGSPANPYTVGTGGDIDIPRPTWIPNAGYEFTSLSPVLERGLVVLDDDEYAALPLKALAGPIPQRLHYNKKFDTSGVSVGLGDLFLHPVPNGAQALNLVLYLPTPMTGFADIGTTEYTFPPGYTEALVYQLAKRLCIPFDKQMTKEQEQLTVDSFAAIQKPNAPMPKMRTDYGLPGGGGGYYDWRTGTSISRSR